MANDEAAQRSEPVALFVSSRGRRCCPITNFFCQRWLISRLFEVWRHFTLFCLPRGTTPRCKLLPLSYPYTVQTEQGPSQHGDLGSQSDSGFLLACLLLATDAVVNFFGPWVVAERCPCAFDENRTGHWIASFGNTAIAICFTRFVLARDQAKVSRDLASVLEAVGIVDAGNEDLCSTWSHAGYGFETLDTRGLFADGFKPFHDRVHMRGDSIELCQFKVEFTFS